MSSFDEHYRRNRLGSAGWATDQQYKPLLVDHGLYVGLTDKGQVLRNPFDAPSTIIAGSGAGKNACAIMINCCTFPGNMIVVDVKAENAAVSLANLVRYGKHGYCLNSARLLGLPNHSTDPLDILTGNSDTLVGDAKMLAEMLIALTAGDSVFFQKSARAGLEALMVADAEINGAASLLRLYKLVSAIEGDLEHFLAFVERMYASCHDHVRRFAGSILHKMKEAPKEASGIISEMVLALAFMDDPLLRAGLDKPYFSLKVLCERPANVYVNVPAEYLGTWASYLRLVLGVAMLYRTRHVNASRLTCIADEAGQLGKADFLERAMTLGRGQGVTTQCVFQSVGQIEKLYGRSGIQTFLSSAVVQQWFGIRDYATAQLLSQCMGYQTLEWDSELEQAAARRNTALIIKELLDGGDFVEAGLNYAQQARASVHKQKSERALATADEVLRMKSGTQVVLTSGIDCPPIASYIPPYYRMQSMAGQYKPSPLHPPVDRVCVQTRWGKRWRRVITQAVPEQFADWPQYQDGLISYIEGYRPF